MHRPIAVFMLLASAACSAAPQPIEGWYRYGHEVNAVCTGEPEACYWLVDTDAQVRRQLRRQVEGLAPYTPVCVRLHAELSTQKADGFGLDYDGSIRVGKLLGSCASARAATSTRIEDLRHRRWKLWSIDGVELAQLARAGGHAGELPAEQIPELDFGEQDYLSGSTGCNRFEGRARVVDNDLIIEISESTEMSCSGFGGAVELTLRLLYRNPLTITRNGNALILEAADSELRFELRDWVQ